MHVNGVDVSSVSLWQDVSVSSQIGQASHIIPQQREQALIMTSHNMNINIVYRSMYMISDQALVGDSTEGINPGLTAECSTRMN